MSSILSSFFNLLVFLEYQPAIEAAAASASFGNFQNEFVLCPTPPDEPARSTCSAITQDLDCLAVYTARRLRAGTSHVLEVPFRSIEVKDGARADGPAVRFDPIQREHLAPGVRLDSNREAPGLSVSGKRGPSHIQLPGSVCRSSPASGGKRYQEKNGSHEDTMRACLCEDKS
jgi:hypothetical protein